MDQVLCVKYLQNVNLRRKDGLTEEKSHCHMAVAFRWRNGLGLAPECGVMPRCCFDPAQAGLTRH